MPSLHTANNEYIVYFLAYNLFDKKKKDEIRFQNDCSVILLE